MRIDIVVTHGLSPETVRLVGLLAAVAVLLVLLVVAVRRPR